MRPRDYVTLGLTALWAGWMVWHLSAGWRARRQVKRREDLVLERIRRTTR